MERLMSNIEDMFSIFAFTCLAAVLPSIARAEFCAYVITQDCFFLPDRNNVCGTNGETYRNNCALAKAYCHDMSIHKAHDGPCGTVSTTPTPVDGSHVVMDIFCLDLVYTTCKTGGTQICGSNGNFYANVCEFDKARCLNRSLTYGTNCQ
ncbi:uncharacterized protein LOC127843037 [Dreissena polymorpha]|uniref:Kazal-like domain-containing protein n=1 Tax=Dreissena polymorpha TaxID=45954 RepID=A0A9D4MZ48_DREPO|nr:uncharacterized protein LOC127843037 [Dreissena polymorpha]KAH3886642.1 hypothetical protein DPMN_010654 [Dreissena polymorpha]